jgi:hypothetical protein
MNAGKTKTDQIQVGDTNGRLLQRTCIIRKGYSARILPCLLLVVILLSVVIVCASGSTPPPQPLVSVQVVNQTISPGSGIDVSVEYTQNGVLYPHPPETMDIYLYKIPDGSLLGKYEIPLAGVRDGGAIHLFRGTIPGPVLPGGDVMLVATDPETGANSRIPVSIPVSGELYQDYRNRQVIEGMFYPVSGGLIVILVILLGFFVAKRT